MFVLRAERALWETALQDVVGDTDMAETAKLVFASGMHPRYRTQERLVWSDVAAPASEADVVGVATLDFPMIDNPRLATLSIVVSKDRRGAGIGTQLHAAALEVARKHNRSTVQTWTWESMEVPPGAETLSADGGSVDATSASSRFLSGRGYTLGQVERLARLILPSAEEATTQRDQVISSKHPDYEVITLKDNIPERLLGGVAQLCAAMSTEVPTCGMDLDQENWDAARVRAAMDEVVMAGREQLLTLIRHLPTQQLVAFTRIYRDTCFPQVVHQWETLVLEGHRGRGLGKLMKIVNHATAVEVWPGAQRLITGNASQNKYMLAINNDMGFVPFAASGFWELRARGTDG